MNKDILTELVKEAKVINPNIHTASYDKSYTEYESGQMYYREQYMVTGNGIMTMITGENITETLDKLEAHTCPECYAYNEKAGRCSCQKVGV